MDEYAATLRKDQELMEIKEASYEAKLNEMAKQIETIKAESTKQKVQCPPQPSARKSLGTLRRKCLKLSQGQSIQTGAVHYHQLASL